MQSGVLSAVLALSGGFLFFLAGYGFSRRRIRGSLEFAGLFAASALYTLGYALELGQTDLAGMLAALRVQYPGIAFICFFWLLFALRFSGTANPGWRARTLLALPSLAVVVVFWTDPLHHLFYASTWVRTDGPFPVLGVEPGPAYWAHIAVSQLELIVGTVILLAHAVSADPPHRHQARFVAAAALCPWIFLFIYIAGVSPWGLDVTPIGLACSGLVMAWALFRLRILDLVPTARELAIGSLQDGFLVMDERGLVAEVNDAARSLLSGVHLRVGEAPGAANGRGDWAEHIRRLASEGEGRLEIRQGERGRAERRLSVQSIPVRTTTGSSAGAVLVIRDVSETAALLDRLAEMTDTDELTGLLNRRRFFEVGAREMARARRAARPLAAAVLDLDEFNRVNERFGHDAGDVVLRSVAARLRTALRTGDVLCRYGGEELAVLMPDTDNAGATRACERFRQSLAQAPFDWKRQSISVTASVGLFAGVPGSDDGLERFFSRADIALNHAKVSGRNRCEIWYPNIGGVGAGALGA